MFCLNGFWFGFLGGGFTISVAFFYLSVIIPAAMFLLHDFLTANEMYLCRFSLNISSVSHVPYDALQAVSAEPPKQGTQGILGLLKLFNMEQISKFDHELSEILYLQSIPWNRLVTKQWHFKEQIHLKIWWDIFEHSAGRTRLIWLFPGRKSFLS